MSTKLKAPSIVELAMLARDAKFNKLHAAQAVVLQLQNELCNANVAIVVAQKELDSPLPQCRLIRVHSRSGKQDGIGRPVVILRKTPGGLLICRHFGDPAKEEIKFKWSPYGGVYREVKKPRCTQAAISSLVTCRLSSCPRRPARSQCDEESLQRYAMRTILSSSNCTKTEGSTCHKPSKTHQTLQAVRS